MFDLAYWFYTLLDRKKKPIVKEEVRPPPHELFEEIRSNRRKKEQEIINKEKSAPTEQQLIEKNTEEIIEYIGKNLEEQFYKFKKENALCIVYHDYPTIIIKDTLTFDDNFFTYVRECLELQFDEEVIIQFKCEKTFKHYCEFMEKDLYTLTINVYAIVSDLDIRQENYPDNFMIDDTYDIRGKCYHDIMEYIHSTTQQKEN